MITSSDIAQILSNIFPPKPEPISSALFPKLQEVVELAQAAGLEFVPSIIVRRFESDFTGRVNTYDYSEFAIEINTILWLGSYQGERSIRDMRRTLAHELGHCYHMQKFHASYETHGFAWCEDFADNFADSIGIRSAYRKYQD